MRRLQEEDVDVCFLLEVMGSQEAFTAKTYGLRALAKKIGYEVRWMVGEGGSQREQRQSGESFTNGIAVLVKQATCTIERYARLEERVLGVWIRGRGTMDEDLSVCLGGVDWLVLEISLQCYILSTT
jgi:hypothetical protein